MSGRLSTFALPLIADSEGEQGQTLVEYAFLMAFIAIIVLVAVQLLGTNVSSLFNSVASAL